jgi:hypothetical protein
MSATDRLRFAGADLVIAFSSLLARPLGDFVPVVDFVDVAGRRDLGGLTDPVSPVVATAFAVLTGLAALACRALAALPATPGSATPPSDRSAVAAPLVTGASVALGCAGFFRVGFGASIDAPPDAFLTARPDLAGVPAWVFAPPAFATPVAFRAAPARSAITAP